MFPLNYKLNRKQSYNYESKKVEIHTMKRIIHRERSDFLELERDSARKVIFLDIDGVLNQDNGGAKIEEQFVRRLAHIVEETGAEIVLSSSWRGAYVSHVDPE